MKISLSTFSFLQVSFSPLLLWIPTENRAKLKKILNLNHRLKWNTRLQVCKLHLIFYEHFYQRTIPNEKQTKTNMERRIMLIRKFVQKYNERNILTLHEIIDCIAEKTFSDHSTVRRNKMVDSSELTANKFLIYLFIYIHLFLYCRYMDLHKAILLKKIRNQWQPLKLHQKIKIFRLLSKKF